MARENRELLTEAISAEVRASQNQSDLFDETASLLLGINRTDLRCMDILERNEGMTAGDLAAAAGLTSGAVTAVLDRMERAGYAQRLRDRADRRRVLVVPTLRALQAGGEIHSHRAAALASLLEGYNTKELMTILDFLRRSRELTGELQERLSAQARALGRTRANAGTRRGSA